jgi:hypothetical protein
MSNDTQYPYGYQLSFFERFKLRLKKINYRLSMGITVSIFTLAGIAFLIEEVVPESQFLYWQKFLSGMVFLLFGFQGLIWAVTGELKKTANLTSRGKWVAIVGGILWVICWSIVANIILSSMGIS